ncbi:uncharacterized protein LOC121837441 [Ixodes scapularis]|uniref:uncharacterized protein LOC121837441 n=1 Tax=Ixodes scapularis TaxID=6945 RepID=UPI001C39438F|nr:uncharacterized protein LOC121837441 [Ixodes scapularis]
MERLKTKRTTRRAQNTRLINEASALLQNQDSTISQITTVAERLRANNDELRRLNEEFEGHIPDGSFETEFQAVVQYEDEATATISALQCRKDLLDQISSRGAPREPSRHPNDTQGSRQAGTRLPKLTITPFKGEISKWSAFWEQFDETIHKNASLSTSEKFGYLRMYLGGEAEAAVAGLPRTETCYADAIEILNRRFGDKKRLEQEYFSSLRLISPVKSANDTSGLRTMFDQVQINIRGLQTLGVNKSSFSSMLCDILMRALPRDIVVNYHRTAHLSAATAMPGPSSQPDRSELDRLLDFLAIEVESREKSEFKITETKNTKTTRYEDNIARRESSRPTSSVLYNRPSPHKTRCCFCNGTSHSSADCSSSLPLDQKKQRLTKEMRCFRCTLSGHRARDCRRKISCATCGGRHAKSMCDPTRIKAKEGKSDTQNSMTVCTTSIHREFRESGAVLLQTFRAWAVSGTSCRYVRGVIDGGSQQTFVTEDLSRHLQLKCVGYTKMALNTFACASTQQCKKRRVVELELRSQFNMDGCKIEAIEIPVICQDIATLTTDSVFVADMEKNGKFIADRLMFPAVAAQPGISILIGSDQMWGFMTGEVTRSKTCSTLVALNTKLGWTFQGRTSILKSQKNHSNLVVCVLQITGTEQVEGALRSFWELESLGITDSEDQMSETSQVMRHFEQNIRRSGTQYEVALPWKDNIGVLKDNKQVAMTRLRKLNAGMTLRKWTTNSQALRDVLLQEEANPENTTPILEQRTMKVLGIVWDPEKDVLKFALPILQNFLELHDGTKRFVLQAASRIFDPLGVLSPFTIRVKTLFQKLWARGITWDSALPEDLNNEWHEWCGDLPKMDALVIPRFVFQAGQGKDTQIHIFCDASPTAYGATVYVTTKSSPPEQPTLLLAKARVAPIKKQTLPRLELMGAVIASRLHKYLEKTIPCIPYDYTLWTDSLITLAWIKSDPSKWKTFVSNRVAEIQRDTDPSHWRYCPGNDNPADLLTRGITGSRLVSSDLWWSGPKWLTENENEWPDLRSSNEAETDLLKEERKAVHVILQTTPPEPLLDLTKYSELHRALRVTAWCLRFLRNCRNGKPSNGPLSAEETTAAELYWINNVQNSTYSDEIKCLSKKENVHKQSSLAEMSPFLDKDNIIRVGGRLQMLPASDNVKHPIILPSEHYFTTLVVQNAHCKRQLLARTWLRMYALDGFDSQFDNFPVHFLVHKPKNIKTKAHE